MNLYLLTLTDEGSDRAPSYEINRARVVAAGSNVQARAFAAASVIDEPREVWSNPDYSRCRQLGGALAWVMPGVVLSDSNAS